MRAPSRLQKGRDLITLLENLRDYARALDYAWFLLRSDPLDEDTYLRLMRLQALNGDRAGAVRTYQQCVATLRRDLGVDPGPAVQAAYTRLLRPDTPETAEMQQRAASRVSRPTPLIGRDPAWAQLRAAWHTALGGRTVLALITGEAGMGKTRLAEELLGWAGQQGIAIARTRAYAAEGGLAYAPVADWLRSGAIAPALARLDQAEATMALGREHHLGQWLPMGAALRGWAWAGQNAEPEALDQGRVELQHGIAAFHATGFEALHSYFLALLADIHLQAGDSAACIQTLRAALAHAHASGEWWYASELYRRQGEVSMLCGQDGEAEAALQRALDIARGQEARSFELRAAVGLAQLWQRQGRPRDARRVLSPIYHWFGAGSDSPDVNDARALLAELERAPARGNPRTSQRGNGEAAAH